MKEVKIFAYLREVLGLKVTLPFQDPVTKKNVIETFQKEYPHLKEDLMTCEVAINQEFLDEQDQIPLNDVKEMALIPPVSGG